MSAYDSERTAHLQGSSDTGWLWTPPTGEPISPPASSRQQVLPFDQLTWDNFERLCLRLALQEGAPEEVQVQRYGRAGQRQHGIDILVRHPTTEQHEAWQCKRWKTFTPARIRAAVDKFLRGKWAERTSVFHLCLTTDLADQPLADEIDRQAERLRKRQITFASKRVKDKGKARPAVSRQARTAPDSAGLRTPAPPPPAAGSGRDRFSWRRRVR